METIKKYSSSILAFALGFILAFFSAKYYFKTVDSKLDEQLENNTLEIDKILEEGKKQAEIEKEIIDSKEPVLAQETNESTESNFDYIKVSDQKAGKEVNVAYANAEFPFWLVVHAEKDGKIWNALGARRKEAGEHTGVVVPLLASTKSGSRYWVVLYKDNGDKNFDLKTDFPVKKTDGSFIMVDFKAL